MSQQNRKDVKPLAPEWKFLILLAVFFAVAAALYGVWSYLYYDAVEPIGTTALTLLVGLCTLSGGYLFKLSREIEVRPEDDPYAEQHDAAGEYGHFSPWSWWPLVCGLAVSLMFLGPALHQWWILGVGVVVGIIGVAGQVTQYSRGPHAH